MGLVRRKVESVIQKRAKRGLYDTDKADVVPEGFYKQLSFGQTAFGTLESNDL